jgi:hypothetical protein
MNPKILTLLKRSGLPALPIQNDIFLEKFAQLVAEDCAGICEEMGTKIAGCNNGVPTLIADDCAWWIRNDFGIK